MTEDRATERPWRLRKVTFPDRTHEWHLDSGAWRSAVIVYGNEAKDWEAEGRANAALIVEAVNAYDRLRAIEAAARALEAATKRERLAGLPYVFEDELTALRAALDPATTEPKETQR